MGFRTKSPIKFFPIVLASPTIPFQTESASRSYKGLKKSCIRLRAGDYRVVFQRSGTRIDIVRVLSKPDFQKAY